MPPESSELSAILDLEAAVGRGSRANQVSHRVFCIPLVVRHYLSANGLMNDRPQVAEPFPTAGESRSPVASGQGFCWTVCDHSIHS